MEDLFIQPNNEVIAVINRYEPHISTKLMNLRRLIIETAQELNDVETLEETLKWGEPSYITKIGSTIRIDWKAKTPNKYAIYFKCTSKLVPTFKELFGNTFKYESTRAISFDWNDPIPEYELKQCIAMALRYHQVKNLPLLGADISPKQ